jgi:hypothetical protein
MEDKGFPEQNALAVARQGFAIGRAFSTFTSLAEPDNGIPSPNASVVVNH